MRVAFRLDAGPAVGGGHLMRCLVLAEALARRGAEIGFLIGEDAPWALSRVRQERFAAAAIASPAAHAIPMHLLPAGFADLLVIDHYGIPAAAESAARASARTILAFDDMPTRPHDCDLLVDQNFGADAAAYRPLVPAAATICAGIDFALLRQQFREARATLVRAPQARRDGIFVSFGMSDTGGLSLAVVQALRRHGAQERIEVVAGSHSAGLDALARLAQVDERLCLHVDATAVAPIMARSAVAIGAGGSMHWERCCLGLPTIAVVLEENQRRATERLAEAGAAEMVAGVRSIDADDLARRTMDLLAAPGRREAMSASALAICDGRGAERLADAVDALMASRGR